MSIDGAFSLPDAADTTVHTQQARSLKQDYSSSPIGLRITLPEVTDTEHAAWEGRERTVPLQIGFGREIPAAYQDDLAPRLSWVTLSDGTLVSALSVTSPGALALRVAVFATLDLGAELRFSGPADLDHHFDPLTQSDFVPQASESAAVNDPLLSDPPVWSPVIEGETAWIEVTLPSSAALSTFSLYVDQVSHLLQSMRTPQYAPQSMRTPQYAPQRLSEIGAASCDNHIDVQCRIIPGPQDVNLISPPKLDLNASATAKMIFMDENGDSFGCTGTLLNDGDDSSLIPYFLTAHHCISTQAVARTLVTYWDFERNPCGGPNPGLEGFEQLSGGADLLMTDPDSDSALLRLRRNPPTSPERPRGYAGWSSHRPGPDAAVYGVHHPAGDLKKYSAGVILQEAIFQLVGGQRVDGLHVVWSEGTIEQGSSGSGLFDLHGRLRGVASGAPPDEECPISVGYGRFDKFFPLVSDYLGPEEETPDAESPSDTHGNTLEEATGVKPNSFTPAILGQKETDYDIDYFRVEVTQAGTLTVETTGGTDTVGHLRGADGQWLSYDDDRGLGLNFRIVQSVSKGRYYIRVSGFESGSGELATGRYTLVVGFTPTPTDDHGNTREKARSVKPTSSTPGVLERQGDVDYFRVLVSEAGTLTVETTGSADTVGELQGADGQWLSEDDDRGLGLNFLLVQQVSAGTYYIRVNGFDNATGRYTLKVRVK